MRLTIRKKQKGDNSLTNVFRNQILKYLDKNFHQRGNSEDVNGSQRFVLYYIKPRPLNKSRID